MAQLEQATKDSTGTIGRSVCVIGLGYIGLPTSCLLADHGFRIHGVDVNPLAVEMINRGEIHLYEPNLAEKVMKAVERGALKASLDPEPADVFIVAVPTPFHDDKSPDMTYVEAATKSIAPFIRPGNLVILESTSPVGTTEKMAQWIRELRPDLLIPERGDNDCSPLLVLFAHCPERVLPGRILHELVHNDRIVGGIDAHSTMKAAAFYRTFVRGAVVTTDARTAELCKLAENSFRDVNIAFANELSLICDRLDIDVWELIAVANRHPRVNILRPGCGVGGHCIAVDPWFIVHAAPDLARLVRTAREVNDYKPHYVVEQVKARTKGSGSSVIACLGLAFKANIDDLRESPAVEIVTGLAEAGVGRLLAVEPHIQRLPTVLQELGNVHLTDLDSAIDESDIVVLLVDHMAFGAVDRKRLEGKTVIDTRGMWR